MALTKITTSVVAVNSLTAANIADNSIDATKIANNQILARHIAAGSLSDQIAANSITAAMIPNATALTLDGGVTIDNITIDGTEIDLSSGDLTVDVAGDITLDADGGDIKFLDDGTVIGKFSNQGSGNFNIISSVQDKDLIFKGNDGGSTITALTLDMSQAGYATFNSGVSLGGETKLGDNSKLIFGAGDDLQIFHDGSNSYIQSTTGGFNITTDGGNEFALTAANNGAVSLFYNGGAKLATTSTGIDVTGTITGDGLTVEPTTATGLIYGADGTNSYINFEANSIGASVQLYAGQSSGGYLGIGTKNSSGTLAEKMRIDANGHVGIGVTSPDEKLHVVGQAVFEGIGNTNRGNIIIGAHGSGSSKWSSLASTHYNDATGSGNGTGAAGNMLIGSFTTSTTNQIYIGGGPYELNPATHIQFYTHSATTHNLGGTEKMRISSNGEITSTTQPAFLVTPSTTQSNIATNATTDINFGTEIFDQGSNFSGNVFTAPVTGRYQFNLTLYLTGFDVSANYYAMYITTSNRNYELINTGSVSGASDPAYRGFGWSCLADMDAGDTAKVNITQSGGAAQTDIQIYSRFSGFLAC